MDGHECLKRWKRTIDSYFTYRKLLFLILISTCLLFYIFPSSRPGGFSAPPASYEDLMGRCLQDRLITNYIDTLECNSYIHYLDLSSDLGDDPKFIPFLGNGFFGLVIGDSSRIYFKHSRTLSLPVNFNPVLSVSSTSRFQEAIVTHFLSGVIKRYQCFLDGLHVTYYYYAHRTIPYLFVQEIKIVNPGTRPMTVSLSQPSVSHWRSATLQQMNKWSPRKKTAGIDIYNVYGSVSDVDSEEERVLAISIWSNLVPEVMEVKPLQTLNLHIPTIIYTEEVTSEEEAEKKKESINQSGLDHFKKAREMSSTHMKEAHVSYWYNLWNTGMSISHSKAAGAINGDSINATMYYVLSNVKYMPQSGHLFPLEPHKYAEGCFSGYSHTLLAKSLWGDFGNFRAVNEKVALWLLTLEKQGCHKLLETGLDGVVQALILSFGGFRFSANHLEFKIDPKHLHRDYFYRRIKYGYNSYINISVTLKEDNKAILGVSVNTLDTPYYACDGGCIDDPVQLGVAMTYLPVKVTEPITSILYVTSDRKHMEEIKDTVHVHKIVEAPAHEHHVIALHKHGHHLGGLPALFWVSVSFLIVVFHLFLFKLIYNEYCGKSDKFKNRHNRH